MNKSKAYIFEINPTIKILNMDSKFVVELEENGDGNLVLPFPPKMLESLDWQEGDTLEFIEDNYSDAFYIRKII